MDITRLEEFILLSKTLNMSVAASQLHVSQSTLSKHIISLEKELGISLINHTAPPTLTQAGILFSEDMSEIVGAYHKSLERLDVLKQRERIVVGVQAVNKMSALETLSLFSQEYPEITIDYLTCSSENSGIKILRKGIADCFVYGHSFRIPDLGSDLMVAPCAKEEVLLWVDKNSPLLSKENLTPEDLSGYVMTTPMGPGAERVALLHECFVSRFNVALHLRHCYFDSAENFFLSKIKNEEVLVFHKSFQTNDVILLRKERELRSFTPPVFVNNYMVFRMETESDGNLNSDNRVNNSGVVHLRSYLTNAANSLGYSITE